MEKAKIPAYMQNLIAVCSQVTQLIPITQA